MAILSPNSTMNQLPPLKLPPLYPYQLKEEEEWSTMTQYNNKEEYPTVFHHDNNNNNKMSTTTEILLPPILTNPTQQQIINLTPPSPPYSTCSVSSSLPSSPSSSSGNSFSSFSSNFSSSSTTTVKKGSIQSLLNSGSELLELEKQQTEQYQHFEQQKTTTKKKKRSIHFDESMITIKKKKKITSTGDDRQMKGLRLFSKQVCDKVAEKKKTTYNEVADELAADILRNNQQQQNIGIDQKNIRRRVYDALNVLMALNLITKDRKEIKWIGLDNNKQYLLEQEIKKEELRHQHLMDSIQHEKTTCHHTWIHLNRLKQLVTRNQQQQQQTQQQILPFPFFLIGGQDILFQQENHHGISFTNVSSIYKDVDILNKICPSSSTTTIVS